jgi:hypothetical protein
MLQLWFTLYSGNCLIRRKKTFKIRILLIHTATFQVKNMHHRIKKSKPPRKEIPIFGVVLTRWSGIVHVQVIQRTPTTTKATNTYTDDSIQAIILVNIT